MSSNEHASIHSSANEGVAEEKKETPPLKNVFVILLVLIVVFAVIYGVLSYLNNEAFKKNQAEYQFEFNHFEFVQSSDGLWNTEMQIGKNLYSIPFHYSPKEIDSVTINNPSAILNTFITLKKNDGLVYVTVDPNTQSSAVIAGVEVARVLGTAYNLYNLRVASAFSVAPSYVNETIEKYPVITCANQNATTVVVTIETGPSNTVIKDKNCIRVIGTNYTEAIRTADALNYHLLGIIR